MGPILKHPSVEEYLTGRKYQDIELCLGKGLKTWPLVTDCSDIFHFVNIKIKISSKYFQKDEQLRITLFRREQRGLWRQAEPDGGRSLAIRRLSNLASRG